MKHTKGKWTASIGDKGATINIDNDANHPLTFEMDFPDKYHHPELNGEGKANASLIASAPEMLKALKDSLFVLREHRIEESRQNELWDLIAKAEGGV